MITRKWVSSAAVAVVFGMAWVAVGSADAGNLDDGFIKGGGAAKIRDYLQSKGYKNVGVLRFEVKKGKAPPSMNVSKMNSLVATRLENALIHVNDPARPIGVTRSAGAVAAKMDKNANWHTKAGRKNLFAHSYPLAWGSKSVPVDAFLTGTVEVSPDYATMKIIVKVFDKKNPELHVVGTPITVSTDRDALREMGHSFVLAKRKLKIIARDGEIDPTQLDQEAVTDVQQDTGDMGMGTGTGGGKNVEQIREFLDFQVFVDDVPAAIQADGDHGIIATPTAGQKCSFKVTAKEKLGLLLKVNGVNILNKEKDNRDRMESSWWVLEPGKEYTLQGFYKDGKVDKFLFQDEAQVDTSELGDDQEKHGTISFEIFKGSSKVGTTDEPKIVPRKTTNLLKVTGRSTTLTSLQKNIGTSLHKLARRNVYLVGGGGTGDAALEGEAFEGFFVAGCDIRYRPR